MASLDTVDIQGAGPADVASYKNYKQDHEFSHDLGIIVLPVASRTPRHRMIRLHGGVAMRTVKWSASRDGKPPIVPAAADLSLDKLVGTDVNVMLPVPLPQSGTYLFNMSGVYVYVQQTPRVVGVNALPTASYPYSVSPQDDIGAALLGGLMANTPTPVTVDDFDAAVTVVDTAMRNGRGARFPWPFTSIPASFAAETIL